MAQQTENSTPRQRLKRLAGLSANLCRHPLVPSELRLLVAELLTLLEDFDSRIEQLERGK